MVTETLEKLRQHVQWHPEAGYAPLIKEAIRALEAALSTDAEPVELPYHCDVCTTPGYGDAPCSPLCDRPALSAQVQDVAAYLYTSKSTNGSLVGFKPIEKTDLHPDKWTCEPLYRGSAKETGNAD